jgi:hypothetical protein
MRRKAIVKMSCTATVYIHEDVQGNQEIEEVDDVEDISDFEVIEIIQ